MEGSLTCGEAACGTQAAAEARTRPTVRATPVPSSPPPRPRSGRPCDQCRSLSHGLPDCPDRRFGAALESLKLVAVDLAGGMDPACIAGKLLGIWVVCSEGFVSFDTSQRAIRFAWSVPIPSEPASPSELAMLFITTLEQMNEATLSNLRHAVGALYVAACKGRCSLEQALAYEDHWREMSNGLREERGLV